MFVIVGNDTVNNKVSIFDTDDGITSKVSYDTLHKGISAGLEVRGINERGNIICQKDDLADEMTRALSPVFSKILILNLKILKAHELLYQALKPYGFVDVSEDLLIKNGAIVYLCKLGKNIKPLKNGKFKISTLYKPTWNDLIIFDTKTEYMLKELSQIPLVEYGEEIQYIGLCTDYVYYVELLDKHFVIELAIWGPEVQDFNTTKRFIRPSSPISYYHYLQELSKSTEPRRYIIKRLEWVRNQKRPVHTKIYEKED